jgi:hypothetical protein
MGLNTAPDNSMRENAPHFKYRVDGRRFFKYRVDGRRFFKYRSSSGIKYRFDDRLAHHKEVKTAQKQGAGDPGDR